MRILLIEDNQKLNENLTTILGTHGFQVTPTLNGSDGLDNAKKESYDLIILDLNLPDLDGIKVCELIRKFGTVTPILMLTARIDTDSKVKGLDAGADDYLTKPFETEELLARVRALMRRDGTSRSSVIAIRNIEVDLKSRTVTKKGKSIALSCTEFRIIEFILNNKGKVCTALEIHDGVWGDESGSLLFSGTLKVHIARIRKKVSPDFIKTIYGEGYIIE